MRQRTAYYGRRDILRGIVGLGAAACGLSAAPARAQSANGLFRRGDPTLSLVSLTYDDCYAIGTLQDLEALLAESPSTSVTFFPTGKALLNTACADESIWKRLRDAGHEIGYHTHEHRHSSELTLEEMRADYALWLEAATAALGEEPAVRFARPPYADLSDSFRGLCEEMGLVVAWWTHDWSYRTGLGPDPRAALQGGDIGLLHPGAAALQMTAEVLDWLPWLGLRGVGLSRLHDAWLDPEPYVREARLWAAMMPTASGEPEPYDRPTVPRPTTAVVAELPAEPLPGAVLRALAVHVTPVRPRGDAWSCDIQVRVANVGSGPARGVWATARLLPEDAGSECAAELRWRLPQLVPGSRTTLTAREAVSGPAAVLLPAGRYAAVLAVGLEDDSEAGGVVSSDAIGPYPFELRQPPRA